MGPLLAGLLLSWWGFRSGLLLSALCYLVEGFWIGQLSPQNPVGDGEKFPLADNVGEEKRWKPNSGFLLAFAGSFFVWQANTLSLVHMFTSCTSCLRLWADTLGGTVSDWLRVPCCPVWAGASTSVMIIGLFMVLAGAWAWIG
jgi:hypothetical protein